MSGAGASRVLHVLDHSLPIGSGYSYRSRSLLLAQRRLGLEPVVLTSPKQGSGRDDVEVLDGIRHYRTGPAGGRLPFAREAWLMARLTARILRVARAERVEVIHAHSPLLNGWPALWAARRLGCRVLYEMRSLWEDAAVSHGTFAQGSLRYRLSRALETALVRRVDAVVAICRGIRAELVARGIPAARISVIPNGVDPEWLEPPTRASGLAARLGLGAGPVLGYIGSFSHYEGLPALVDAAPEILGRLSDARLLLVGDGRAAGALAAAARQAGPGVILTGRLPQAEVRALYAWLDVLVLPRQRTRLTELVTPLKPLEAMAVGTAVLASDIGGHAELISDGETGLLFKAESRNSLVEHAVRLGQDPGLRQRLGQEARRWIERERTWDRLAPGYLRLYGEGA